MTYIPVCTVSGAVDLPEMRNVAQPLLIPLSWAARIGHRDRLP